MLNSKNSCLENLTASDFDEIVQYYLKPNSQNATAKEFKITLHSLKKILVWYNVRRGKYSSDRNKLVSTKLKETLRQRPEIVQARTTLHMGSKRSLESRKKMQESAWKRMEKQTDKYVSKAENTFASFLKNKLGLKVVQQYRAGLKPFDFLIDDSILVEFDGPHHYDPEYYMCKSGKVNFSKQQERDIKRKEIANSLGMKLVVVQQRDVDTKMQLKGDAMHKFMSDLGYEPA